MTKNIDFDKLPIYCINLEKDIERKKFMQLQLNNKNVNFINGIDGNLIDNKTLSKYKNNSQKFFFDVKKKNMSPGEIGCLLSHIKVFNESLKNLDDDYIIVLEDDVNLISFMNNDTKLYLSKIIHEYECIQLCIIISKSVNLPPNVPSLLDWNKEYIKLYPYTGIWSTGAYIISKQARIKIIESFENNELLIPSDFFIYSKINTSILLPPLILPSSDFMSNINTNIDHHILSNNKIINLYFKKKFILINVWFGKLPEYFNLWMYNLNKNYDVLLITDQEVVDYPNNLKIIFMTFEQFNNHLNIKTGFNVVLKNVNKLVDVKPLLGFLFYDFINHYELWGWTDIDMIMGDVSRDIIETYKYDVYSYGYTSFGPLMLFKMSLFDLYLKLENYETILNDEYVCKVDEPWWFIDRKYTKNLQIYKDENTFVKYYKYKNIIDFLKEKRVCIIDWENIDIGIDWNIKKNMCNKKQDVVNYRLCNNKLFKNNKEISFTHLTILKINKLFLDFINKNLNSKKSLSFNVIYNYINQYLDVSSFNTYDTYEHCLQIDFELC